MFAKKLRHNKVFVSPHPMSSFITFPGNRSAVVWNSSFKAILSMLENASVNNQLASHILEANPIAAPIGGLNLNTLTDAQIIEFVQFIADLRDEAPQITESWSVVTNIAQFPIDLQSIIEQGEQSEMARPRKPSDQFGA